MASPIYRFSTGPAAVGPWTPFSYDTSIDATNGQFIRVDLQSTAGVKSIDVTIPSMDIVSATEAALAITLDQAALTGIFQLPAATKFRAYNVQVTVNGGLDSNNAPDATLTRARQINIVGDNGNRAPVLGEVDEYDATNGWTEKLHNVIAVSEPESFKKMYSTITTTGAIPTKAVITVPEPAATVTHATYQISIYALGFDPTAHTAASYVRIATYKWAGGAWTLVGAISPAITHEDVAGWDATFAIVGTTIEVQVTGDAVNDTNWAGYADIRTYAD